METKRIKIVFVYSDILGQRNYRIQFDNGDKYVIDRAACKDTPHDIEVINNDETKIELKGIYENPPGIASPEQNMPIKFMETKFPFKAGETYYLQIISENEINITDVNPTAPQD